jgi:hypothetical protein
MIAKVPSGDRWVLEIKFDGYDRPEVSRPQG